MSNLWNGRLARRVGALALALLLLMPANLVSMLAETLTEETGEGVLICALAEHAHTEDCYEDVLVCGEEARDPVTETVKVYVGALKPHVHTDECRDRDGKLICGIVEKEYYHEHNEYCRNEAGELVCGLEERKPHKHTDRCYADKQTLVCNIAESEGHQHTDACYTERSVLTCQLAESEGHQHTDVCYTDRVDLICQIAENDGHVHTDACYTRTLVCDQEEGEAHQHTDACYEDVLSCNLEVGAGAHKHGDACYAVTRELTCGQEAGAGAHKHGEGCYTVTRELTCGQEVGAGAHKHGEGCYETKRELVCTEGEPVVIDGVTFKIETLTSKASDWTTEEKTVDAGHTHTEACYERRLTCDKQEHTHTAECFAPAVKAGSASTGAPENDDPDETTEEESAGNEAADEGQSEEDGDENADADAGKDADADADAETDENTEDNTEDNNDDAENSADADVADDADENNDADADAETDENTEENNDDAGNSADADVTDDADENNDADADAETDENTEDNNDDAENSADADVADDADENNDADADAETDENTEENNNDAENSADADVADDADADAETDENTEENNDDAENSDDTYVTENADANDDADADAETDENTEENNDDAENSGDADVADDAEATDDADAADDADATNDSDTADDADAPLTDGEEQAEAGPAEGTVSAADAAVVEAAATDLGLERTETPADTNGTVTDATGAERRVFARSDYFGLDISVDEEAVSRDADGLFRVAVTLDAPVPTGVEGAVVDNVSAELYHVADGAAEKVKDATFEYDADNALTGFAFTTASCSPFIVAYTARYHFDIQNYSYDIRGAQDVALSDILSALEIPADAAFYAGVEAISVSDEEILSLTEAEGEWTLRALKEPEGPVYLAIRMADGRDYSIDLAPTGVTELVSENEVAVITAVNDLYLPEDETVYAEITEAGQEHEAVSAVQEQNETTDETSAYQVISVGVENVDAESYEGFEVAVNLEQNLVGTDFQLYQVQDGVATDITDTLALTSETNDDGVEDVTGFTFTTEEFTEYVLCYSLQAFYTTFDGYTFQITLDAGPEAKIPYGAELKVSEILPEEADYDRYLEDSAAQLGVASEAVTFARFFDIQIEYNGDKVEPQAPVQVKIAYQDALPMDETSTLNVVHFADAGTEVISEVAVAEDNTEITYAQDSFSVTGTVITNPVEVTSGTRYAIIVKRNNTYYSVKNDGTLVEVNYSEENNTVKMDYPILWNYTTKTIDDSSITGQGSQNVDVLQLESSAAHIGAYVQPDDWYFYYIDPTNRDAITLEPYCGYGTGEDGIEARNARTDMHKRYEWKSSIVYANDKIKSFRSDNYIGVDWDNYCLTGQATSEDAATIFFAKVESVPTPANLSHTVNHIDISVSGQATLSVPLAYGDYTYVDQEGKTRHLYIDDDYTLELVSNVPITIDDMKTAEITAFSSQSGILDDAFYITGYSQNNSTANNQVRIEGSFKVSDLEPFNESNIDPTKSIQVGSNPGQTPDEEWQINDDSLKQRLEHRIYYTVTVNKDLEFKWIYTDDQGNRGQLMDRTGKLLSSKITVNLSKSFDYWDPDNECPPICTNRAKGGIASDADKASWQEGHILWNTHSKQGSGMDFVLEVKSKADPDVVAIEIKKQIKNLKGEIIHPDTSVSNKFVVYQKTGAGVGANDYDSVINVGVPGSDQTASYDGYHGIHTKSIIVGESGEGIVNDYDVKQGMAYVEEDENSIPMEITDVDGKVWQYIRTYTETEYVWRDNENTVHTYEGRTSVPEIVGLYSYPDSSGGRKYTYVDDAGNDKPLNNGFLEFYFYNVYAEKPRKQEIAPYPGTGILGPVKVGDLITYEISYQNYKDQPAVIHIKDKLDPNVEFVSATEGGALVGDTVKWDLQGVPAHEAGTVKLTVRVLESALVKENGDAGPGKVVNGGDTASVQVDDDHEYTLDTVENPVPGKAETAPYVGTGDLGAVQVGDEITYRISCQNYTENAATIIIKDTLDPNVELKSATNNVTPDGNRVLTWELADVPAGESRTVEITVKVLEGARQPGEVVNTATVQVGNEKAFDLNPVENPVPEEPHKKETAPYEGNSVLGGVKVGDEITYEISYKNYMTEAADVVIKDTLDKNVAFVSASNEGVHGGEANGGVVTWTMKDVPAGTEGTVTLTVKVLPGALVSKGGEGKVVNGGETATVKVGNDKEFTLEVVENPVPEPPHKKETKPYKGTGLLGFVSVGDEITYEISYKNYKNVAANVVIKDQLDENVKFVSASNEGVHGGEANGGVVTWTMKDVPAGTEGTVTLTVEVLSGALVSNGGTGSVINGGETATVQVGNDNAFTLEVVENPIPEKREITPYEGTGVLGAVKVGDEITYEISYRNYKTEKADIHIKDKLDPYVKYVSSEPAGTFNNSGRFVEWKLEGVEAGKTGIVTLTVQVLEGALVSNSGPGKVVNGGDTATVQVGSDPEYSLNTVENPVPEEPHKKETAPYEGTGLLGFVKVGEKITYEISYRNYKTEAADVVIVDQLDENVKFVSASNEGVHSGEANGGVVTWTLSKVEPGTEDTVTLTVKVLPGALKSNGGEGSVVNGGETATVKVGNDNAFTLEVVENPIPEKSETAPYQGTGVLGAVQVGDEITYEISYRNYKDQPATVKITDKLDPNVSFVSASNGGAASGGVVTWTLENVKPGNEGVVTLTVKVLEGAKKPGKVVNTATVQVGNDSEYTLNTVENPVPEEPHKEETAPYQGNGVLGGVKVGDEITYRISYRNYKSEAANVVIKDTLDEHVEFVSATDGVKPVEGVVTWTKENVAAGAEGYVELTVKVLETALVSKGGPGKVVNGGENATVKVGNDKEFTLEVVENPVPEEPEKKEIMPYEGMGVLGGVKVGDAITYEITYRNYKQTAADVVIRDTLDKNVEFVSASDGGANNAGIVNWTIAAVPAGQAGKVTLTVKVLPGALKSNGGPDKVVNGGGKTASVKVGNDDEYYLNEVENPVEEKPIPQKREIGPYVGTGVLGAVNVGDEITYEITYENYKTAAADIVIKDKLDANVAFVSASDGGVNASGVVTWTLKDVPAGVDGAVTLTVKVLEGALVSNGGPGKVVNGGDTSSVKVGNDSEVTLNKVENPVPEIPVPEKKEVAPYEGTGLLGSVRVGDAITYEISYKNYKSEAADVVIKDKLDANVEFVSASDGGANDAGVVTWTFKAVPAGQTGKVTLTVKVLPGALVSQKGPGSVVNGGDTASVKVGNDDEYTLNPVENPVQEEPEKKEIMPYEGTGVLGGVKVGDAITYEITYRNYKQTAADVVIRDTLDKNVEFVSASDGGVNNAGIVTWTLKNVAAGKEGKVTLIVKVLPGALKSNGGPDKVVNGGGKTASVKVGNDDEYYLNEVENPVEEKPVPQKREIGPYVGTGVLGAVNVGDEITYEITYENYKTAAADIVIKDKLDANVAFVSASDGGVNAGGVVTWTLKDVPAGVDGAVTLTVKVLEGALVSEGGPGKVVNGGDTSSVKVGNDSEVTLNKVENPVPEIPVPEKKEVAPYEGTGLLGSVRVGDAITYEISYKNYKSEAADVVIKDKLDANVEFVSASDGGVNNAGVVTWTFKAVPAGQTGKVTLTVKVLPGALVSQKGPGSVVNGGDTASVKVGNDDEYTLNPVENPVQEEPEKKEIMPYEGTGVLGGVKVGDAITYEITYRNYKQTAADIVIKDKLDANVAFVSASDGGVNNAGIVTWTLKNVAAGKAGKVTLTVKVLPGALKSNGGPDKVVNGGGKTASVKVGNDDEYYLNEVENPVEEPKPVQTEPPKLTPTATPTPKPTATATPTPKPTATPTPTPRNNGGGTTTATPTPVPPHDINGRKVWIDENDAHGTRPESITVTLYANGEPLDVEPTWNSTEGNNWSFTFTRMPTVDENGQTINYTVKETPVKYYEATVNGFTITNRLEAPKPERYVTLQGTKTWSDDENALGIRPNVITVRLFRDGVEFDKRDVTAATGWKYDFGRLPADDGYGNIYVYKLDEDPVQGYFKRIDGMNVSNKPLAIKTAGADDDSIYLAKQARLEVLSRRTGTKRPRYEDYTDEELAELFDLFGYGTPLWGALLPTGDETPVYPFIFGGLGALILLALAVTRKKRRTE